MASRSIADLIINLRANTASFVKEIDKSRTLSTAFGVAVGKVFADVAQSAVRLGADVAASLPRSFLEATKSADELAKTSQRTGLAVETLSALKHEASLSDVEFGNLTKSLGVFNRNIGEAVKGNKPLAETMAALGVNLDAVKAGTLSVDEALLQSIDSLAKTDNQFQKTQLGSQAFGRAFQELLPLVNAGRAGFEAAKTEAERLGVIIDTKTAKAAEKFNDDMTRLGLVSQSFGNQLASALLPSVGAFTKELVAASNQGTVFKGIAQATGDVITDLGNAAILGATVFKTLGNAIGSAGQLVVLAIRRDWAGLAEATKQVGRDFADDWQATFDRVSDIWQKNLTGLAATAEATAPKISTPFVENLEEIQKAADAAAKEMQVRMNAIDTAVLQSIEAEEAWFNSLKASERQVYAIAEAVRAGTYEYENYTESLKATVQQTNAIHQAVLDSMEADKEFFEGLKATDAQVAAIAQAVEGVGVTAQRTKSSFEDFTHTLSSGFENAILQGEGLRGTLNGILQDLERLAIRATITGPNGLLGSLLGKVGGAISGTFGAIFGGGVGGAAGAINGGIESRAGGGPVTGGTIYRVHEGEAFFRPDVSGAVGRVGGTVQGRAPVQVDARQYITINSGADPQEVIRALELTRQSAIEGAVQVIVERQLRSA